MTHSGPGKPLEAHILSQTCIATLSMRHMAIGNGTIAALNDLRAPMASVLSGFSEQLAELAEYKRRFGPLDEAAKPKPKSKIYEIGDESHFYDDDGSDTEQE